MNQPRQHWIGLRESKLATPRRIRQLRVGEVKLEFFKTLEYAFHTRTHWVNCSLNGCFHRNIDLVRDFLIT